MISCFEHLRASLVILVLPFSIAAFTADGSSGLVVPKNVDGFLQNYCFNCHDADTEKGDVRLDHLMDLPLEERLDLLNNMQEALHFEEMPPKKKKAQPSRDERAALLSWISLELKKHSASKLEDKLRKPEYGNYVNHEKLFSGDYAELKGFTTDRRWLISEFIFDAKFNRILNHNPHQTIDGKREYVIGDNHRRVNLTNPFLLPTNTGVRYYANETLNGGHLLTMITNAKEAADHMIYQTRRDVRYAPAIAKIMELEWQQEKTLASREMFLTNFIEQILIDVYGGGNDSFLPKFVAVSPKTVVPPAPREEIKIAPWHAANPGREEMDIIYRSMAHYKKDGVTDEERLAKSEREWFYFGRSERKIHGRVTFMKGYMEPYLKNEEMFWKKTRPHVYKPLSDEEMAIISETILAHRKKNDRYTGIIEKCMTVWEAGFEQDRIDAGLPNTELVKALVDELFLKVFERAPSADELAKYTAISNSYLESLGNLSAIEKLIQTLMLKTDFVYRSEFGESEPDESGRQMLSPFDASYAISYALTDSSPDEKLAEAAKSGKLNTREGYRREVTRLLEKRDQFYVIDEGVQRLQLTASITNLPIRKLRFFREFFGYQKMLPIFKDNKRFGGNYDGAKGRLVGEADRLVEYILKNDQNVFEELLTTEKFYVYHSGDNEAIKASADRLRRVYDHFKDHDWENFEAEDLLKHKEFLDEIKMRGVDTANLVKSGRKDPMRSFKTAMTSFTMRFAKGQTAAAPYPSFPSHGPSNGTTRVGLQLRSPEVAKFYNIALENWNYPTTQPAKVVNRKGMLTHPAWLIAHAQNTETDPVIRGKFVREKLLAGTVPDLPITVEAAIPEDHHKTLRNRLADVTEAEYCWKCHEKMNPLGYAFEMYDDFGRFRKDESLEHPDNLVTKGPDKAAAHIDLRDIYKTLPVNATGHLSGSGDKKLDGNLDGAIDLADRLAKSERVRQSIIRHAFRYFMGRNEVLSDSKTLIDADQAYLESGGSFDAVIISLLTSDSFIYRKLIQNSADEN